MDYIIILLVIIIAFAIWIKLKNNKSEYTNKTLNKPYRKSEYSTDFRPDSHSVTYIVRKGKSVVADEAFFAWTSGDLDRMLKALEKPTNLIDRHFLLMNIVDISYKNRKDPKMENLCVKIAKLHIKEFEEIRKDLLEDFQNSLPRVSTFQKYATILTEKGKYNEAIAVCEKAIEFGLTDMTKSGYEGRIERIKKRSFKNNNKL